MSGRSCKERTICRFEAGAGFRGVRGCKNLPQPDAVYGGPCAVSRVLRSILAAATVIACAAVWRVTALEWCLLVGAIGIVCVAELFNTAIESLARAIAIGHHPRIRDALDVASGAVLLSAIVAALIGGIVFVPRASAWLGLW